MLGRAFWTAVKGGWISFLGGLCSFEVGCEGPGKLEGGLDAGSRWIGLGLDFLSLPLLEAFLFLCFFDERLTTGVGMFDDSSWNSGTGNTLLDNIGSVMMISCLGDAISPSSSSF